MSKYIRRRDFLKALGGGVAGASAITMVGCGAKKNNTDEALPAQEPPKDKMTMRQHPETGEKVSLLGYGMMRLPRLEDDQELDQEMVNRETDYALEHGVNFFDTSPAYCQGRSETATGIALSRHKRSEYFISTKLSNFSAETWSLQASQEMFHNSLKNLQVDYVDCLLMHCCGQHARDLEGNELNGMEAFHARYFDTGLLDWLVEQRAAGKIRHLGFSYHGDIEVFDMLLKWHDEGRYHWDVILIELNYLDWTYADEINPRNTDAEYLYNELHKRNIPAMIMEPLLGGRLAGVPDFIAAKMKKRKPENSVASWAFRFAGTFEGVYTVLSGMTYMEHLQDNIRTYAPLEPLTKEEMDFLKEIADDIYDLRTIPCNECNYCMPCPYGIDIPGIFEHYNKMIQEGNLPKNRNNKEYARRRHNYLVGYDRSVPRLRQANHCINCGQCLTACPQRIDIPNEMRRLDRFVENLKRNGMVENLS